MNTSKDRKRFSVRKRIRSFKFAFTGIAEFFVNEHNAWIHLLATIAAIALAFILQCSKTEFILIVLTIGFVWAAELFNTAIEKMADLITTEIHPQIKIIKDLSAAAVLITALAALITGLIIFIPKIILYADIF
jgi:diacylglycerol kinase (ATP)